jgi:hypothetical protein
MAATRTTEPSVTPLSEAAIHRIRQDVNFRSKPPC